jgi:hypothetical protein
MPYGFLADLEGTAKLREKLKKSLNFEIKNLQKGELEKAQALLMLSESMRNQILSERPELLKEANKWQGNNGKLFKLFAEDNKNVDLHQWAQIHLKGFTHCPQRFCLSESWVSWNYLKVSAIIACSYFKKHKDPSTVQQLDKVERDLQDIKYVTLLSRADGLLSNDKSIVLPLARAVFPQKNIFCDIDEVSNAYICNW